MRGNSNVTRRRWTARIDNGAVGWPQHGCNKALACAGSATQMLPREGSPTHEEKYCAQTNRNSRAYPRVDARLGKIAALQDLTGDAIHPPSPKSDFHTGQMIYVGGGYTAG
jgi:hypothetical protein